MLEEGKKMKRPTAKFIKQNNGGSYKLEIYLVENASDNQNAWANSQGNIVYDYQLRGVTSDLKKDGFKVSVV